MYFAFSRKNLRFVALFSVLISLTCGSAHSLDSIPASDVAAANAEAPAFDNPIRDTEQGKKSKPAPVYVCPMHDEVRSDKPGKCPKCGMRLKLIEPEKTAPEATHGTHGH